MSNAKDPFLDVPSGQTVFREGDIGTDMFIIESGTIEIRRTAHGAEPVATLGPGDFFGDMAMLEDEPRFASAVAVSAARLLRIERAAFTDVLKQNAEIAIRIMRKLVARQRHAERRVQELQAELAKVAATGHAVDSAADKSAAPAQFATQASPPPGVAPMQLRHAASGQCLAFDSARTEFLIGRPDPVSGMQPEINLGPFDQSRTLSRRHAKILLLKGAYVLREEVGTTNGTFVNGQRIKTGTDVVLKAGDQLRFGSVEVEFISTP